MLKAAVIGLGWWGKHIIRYLKSSDRISIIAAVDTNPVAVHSFAAEYGIPLTDKFEDVLDDAAVDAVILTTPHGFHEQQVIAAANAGKQVFCEKPLTLTVDAAERMLRACDDAGIILGIGHERRYEPALEEIKRRVDAGEAGTLMHIEINCSYPLFAAEAGSDWRRDPAHAPAGALTALGVHMTDYMQTLAGDATRIYAQLSDRTRDCPLDDVLAVHLTFASGATGYLCAIASTPFHQHITVFGRRMWMESREISNVHIPDPAVLSWRIGDGDIESKTYPHADTFSANLNAWADAVAGRGDYRFTRHQLLHNVRMIEAIVTSTGTGKPVSIP